MLANTIFGTDVTEYYGRINVLLAEADALMHQAHQHFLVKSEDLAAELASDARDRAQSAAALLSSFEDADIIHSAYTLGTRRLLYVTINYPKQTFVLACVDKPDECYFCGGDLYYGFGSVPHAGFVSAGYYTKCDICDCHYHQINDTPLETGS